MAPFNLMADWGNLVSYVIPLLIGTGFGAALEMSGFGDSRKLTGQFYLKDLTVLKVMFSAVVVAGLLIGLTAALGLVNMDRIFVNPTYLTPGIVGGLLMGFGFIVGGFCPGTSLVSAATLKIDGIVFMGGVVIGVFAFGETVGSFETFYNSGFMGRFTLPELFGVDTGIVLMGISVMALFLFAGGEVAEAYFGRGVEANQLRFFPKNKWAWIFAGTIFGLAVLTAVIGQPSADRLWDIRKPEFQPALESKAVYVHPIEVAEITQDTAFYTKVLDLRAQSHFNLFHLRNSENVTMDQLKDPTFIKRLKALPPNTAIFTVSNDDQLATDGYKLLAAQGVANAYIIEGGINRWLTIYPPLPCLAGTLAGKRQPEELAFNFYRAVGDCCNTAYPEVKHKELPTDCYLSSHPNQESAHSKSGVKEAPEPEVKFEHKVKLQKKASVKGGCG